ncbi:hypothetical protein MKW94_026957 [Papaver nudicaule]|uniref:Uncharacterized protein n=1 Tax=Papaver nudicaule TaxID=74823 RepID=A0AA42B3P4_PAPNU|nr:hypothetical protein [Papaver nudicaule]MCL7049201.1 hypothetical protein [Papaver nudicaule]
MASSSLLFSPLPSTAFLHKNPNLSTTSSSLLCNFSPLSISISINKGRKSSFYVSSSSVVGYPISADISASFDAGNGTSRSSGSRSSSSSGGGEDGGGNLDIAQLGISDEIVSALKRRGITQLFPIQRAVLEPAMAGRDMIGRAITGSGKTLAFGIPILDKIIRNRSPRRQRRAPTALVLAPTRELARQVQKEFKESAPNLSSACLYGGIPITNQIRSLGMGIDIAVGTPGRIIDLVERGALNLSEVKFVVLDEADQMLAIGFQEDVECILNYLPEERQVMLFSATMPSWVNELSRKYLKKPLVIDLVGDSEQKLADGITLLSIVSSHSGKENTLSSLISTYGQGGKSIIFTRTKKDAEELSRSMGAALSSKALHGNMQQFQRDKTLAAFRDGRFNVLVATDVAARGLDIPNVDLVIHFEIPNTSEIFVHRSGRTGRAGKKGTAILMYTKAQRRAVTTIERDLGCRFKELPSIAGSIGSMDGNDRSYGRFGDSGMNRQFGSYSESRGNSGERQYGGYSGSRGNSSERQYGGYSGSRGNSSERQPGGYSGSRGNSSERQFGGYGGSRGSSSERQFGGYGGSRGSSSERQSGGYGGSRGNIGERQSGGYSGSRGDTYGTRSQEFRGSRLSEDRFGGIESSRSDDYSRISDSMSIPFAKGSRGSQSNKYNDSESKQSSEDGSVEKKRDAGFKQILDMLREQT